MPNIALIGAGSVVFAQKLISDILQRDGIGTPEFRLMDIDPERLRIAGIAAEKTARALGKPATIRTTVGDTETIYQDFDIPARYGLRQTIADTLGIGGIFRALRTYPVMMDLVENITTGTAAKLAGIAGVAEEEVRFRCAGINHMAFYTEFRVGDRDLYPVLFERLRDDPDGLGRTVRFEMLRRTGYFVTESSEHQAEYTPCEWEQQQREFSDPDHAVDTKPLSHEYGSIIIEAIETGVPATIHGNVLNHGLIDNLPADACVEVACHVDGTGLAPVAFGRLPTVLAGIIGSNIAVQLATVEAAESRRREAVYHAAMLDPHTAASLTLDQIWQVCDEMLEAQAPLLPAFDTA
ncbi:Alpha-galactosidase [Geodia barretti]|uniref:Alpha-galactosidase n=1 Tax=Geodia barretti TaxID=519541 RepID=A0AA35S9Z9_GEOBA|nr:Alpha-galactosidase [Geodia barretti]